MKYPLLLLSLLLFTCYQTYAADFEFGKFDSQEVRMKKYDKDTSAHAVVLNEFGKAYISTNDHLHVIYEHHVKVKIFDSQAFQSEGNIVISLRKEDNNSFETIRDIEAVTTYTDEDGNIRQSALDASKIFKVNHNKYTDLAKFDMPNLRPGCIIEYRYITESPFLFNFHTWDFQSDIPKIHSEYLASIPAVFQYNVSLRGPLKLTKQLSELHGECFSYAGTRCDCSDLTYIMDDVPAFVEEEYMTASKNFLSAMYFELSEYINFNSGAKMKVTKEWRDVDISLKNNEYFGSQIKRSGLMKDRIKDVIANKTDELTKARAIYEYIQKTIKWDQYYGKYSDGIRTALDKHTGSIGDINLSLIAALKAAGLNTEAVLLSTREHGLVNRLFPVESDFNYVIAKVNIAGKSYLLDASDQLLGFGMLPLRCINDQGRVLSFEKDSYWIDIAEPQKESKITNLDLVLQADGKLKGTLKEFSSGYAAYLKRKEIKKFNSFDEYVENLDERFPKIKILKSEVQNVDSLNNTVLELYDVEINAYKNMDHEKLTLNPFVFGHTKNNPFKLTDRTYPVDMGVPSVHRFTVTVHMPGNFFVESGSKDMAISLPNMGGSLLTQFTNDTDSFTFSEALQFTKPVYDVNEYPYLKEFYNKIIQAEGSEILFRRK